jgi:ABC-type ATPase with predicted acetyltransferase domain
VFIKEKGMAAFLKKEAEKWRCPECGGVISCHNGICYSCGLEKLKQKHLKYSWED